MDRSCLPSFTFSFRQAKYTTEFIARAGAGGLCAFEARRGVAGDRRRLAPRDRGVAGRPGAGGCYVRYDPGKAFQFGRCCDESVSAQVIEVFLDGERRGLQAIANFPGCFTEDARNRVQVAIEEFVGTLDFAAEGSNALNGKILEVPRYDHVAASDDGSRKHVAVVRVREFDRGNERTIPCDQAVTGGSIHEIASAFERGTIAMRLIAQEGVDPLSMDVCRPSRPKGIADRQLHEQIAYRRRVEDVGIEQCGVTGHGRS